MPTSDSCGANGEHDRALLLTHRRENVGDDGTLDVSSTFGLDTVITN